MNDEDILPYVKAAIARVKAGSVVVSNNTAIYHDLGIAGDDAGDLLDDIRAHFGTNFSAMHIPEYFPLEGWDSLSEHFLRLFKLSRAAHLKRLTVAHLIAVVRRGEWFEETDVQN